MNKSKKLQQLEAKFGLAENLIEELSSTIEDITTTELSVIEENSVSECDKKDDEILNVTSLKQDFMLIRNNLIKLINTGQRILEGASVLDISDLKPSHLESLSNLQSVLGNNMKMLIELYQTINNIEKTRQKALPKQEQNPTNINNTNNNLFVGNSADLLKLLNEQSSPTIVN